MGIPMARTGSWQGISSGVKRVGRRERLWMICCRCAILLRTTELILESLTAMLRKPRHGSERVRASERRSRFARPARRHVRMRDRRQGHESLVHIADMLKPKRSQLLSIFESSVWIGIGAI
jgi:hypothetical protein